MSDNNTSTSTKLNPDEPWWPQLLRQLLVMAGGALATHGVLDAADWQIISGAIMAVAPIAYRYAAIYLARRNLK